MIVVIVTIDNLKLLISIKDYDYVLIYLRNSNKRYELIKMFKKNNFKSCNLIRKKAVISQSAKHGTVIFISHRALLNTNIMIGKYFIMKLITMINHNRKIEMNSCLHTSQFIEANFNYPFRTTDGIKVNLNVCTFDE